MAKAARGKTSDKKSTVSQEGTTVLVAFRDINDFSKEFLPGEDVSNLPKDRISKLKALGYVGNPSDVKEETEDDE